MSSIYSSISSVETEDGRPIQSYGVLEADIWRSLCKGSLVRTEGALYEKQMRSANLRGMFA